MLKPYNADISEVARDRQSTNVDCLEERLFVMKSSNDKLIRCFLLTSTSPLSLKVPHCSITSVKFESLLWECPKRSMPKI